MSSQPGLYFGSTIGRISLFRGDVSPFFRTRFRVAHHWGTVAVRLGCLRGQPLGSALHRDALLLLRGARTLFPPMVVSGSGG